MQVQYLLEILSSHSLFQPLCVPFCCLTIFLQFFQTNDAQLSTMVAEQVFLNICYEQANLLTELCSVILRYYCHFHHLYPFMCVSWMMSYFWICLKTDRLSKPMLASMLQHYLRKQCMLSVCRQQPRYFFLDLLNVDEFKHENHVLFLVFFCRNGTVTFWRLTKHNHQRAQRMENYIHLQQWIYSEY